MRKTFMKLVSAPTPDAAVLAAGSRKRARLIDDEPEQVRAEVLRKVKRVEENPAVYGDKIAEYHAMLDRFDATEDQEAAVVRLILDHGDGRVDNDRSVGVRPVEPGRWWVFGYE